MWLQSLALELVAPAAAVALAEHARPAVTRALIHVSLLAAEPSIAAEEADLASPALAVRPGARALVSEGRGGTHGLERAGLERVGGVVGRAHGEDLVAGHVGLGVALDGGGRDRGGGGEGEEGGELASVWRVGGAHLHG